jgi:phosphoenolpyruvate synthase/pyruvate phosphate dikinase
MVEPKMEYIPGHLKKNLEKWKGKDWYHQRFDGSPYFIHFIGETQITRHVKRKQGGEFSVNYCFFENGKADWYILMDDIKRVANIIINLSKKNPNISKKFIKLWEKDRKLFYKTCLLVDKTDLSKLSNSELIKLHDNFAEITLDMNSSSSLIDGFALGTDELIAKQIQTAFESSSIKGKMRFTEVFSILTAPVHLSFIVDAEIELLRLALLIQKNDFASIFLNESIPAIREKISGTKIKTLLMQHQKKYFWTINNYVSDVVLSEEYFIEELKKILSLNIDLQEEIKKIISTPKVSKIKKKKLLKQLKLSKDLRTLLTISEDFTYWQDERKKSTFWVTHYFSLILSEIAKRTGINLENLKYLSCRELSKIFISPIDESELIARKKGVVYYWDKNGVDALHSKDAEMVKEAILVKTDFSDVNDFRGLTASLGKVVGPVKVIKSATEINRVNQGDVLVAVMTRPDYVPAMKKASAIVTDEGGITCHAAIVSREIGIPCIIGTKIATKVLKDGMMVEVNANHGWVKIIRK